MIMRNVQRLTIGLVSIATAALVLVAPPAANAAPGSTAGVEATYAFPSADSTVIGSTGFIDSYQVGYFWSAARGDSVEQTFSGPKKVKKAVLKLDVTYNGLAADAETDWSLTINGTEVGTFVIASGTTGPYSKKFKFPKVKAKTYDVKIAMTNEVAGGDGAIALRYAQDGPHSITLKKR